jgi:hypothetical protein
VGPRALLANWRGISVLLAWAILVGIALRTDAYGLTEEGAKALLLAWSIGDAVASAAFTLGAPDIRVVVFLPLGFLWSGQVLAAKILTLLIMAIAATGLYRWRRREDQEEAALLATGLLLICPLTLDAVNSLSTAPFLLAIFGAAASCHRRLGAAQSPLGGWFFAQVLGCAAAVSLHPAGLAYPAMLFYVWWRAAPDPRRHREYFLIAIPLAVVLALAMRLGWPGAGWLQNPLASAAAILGGGTEAPVSGAALLGGFVLIAATAAVAWHEQRRLFADLTGGCLLLGALIGAIAADRSWALLLFALLLYGGIPWLLRACAPLAGRGLMAQRGWLWLILFIICTLFMRSNRSAYEASLEKRLAADDQVISDFAEGINSLRAAAGAGGEQAAKPIVVASSWPARTSIACRCDGLPLPPVASDPPSQLAMMRGVAYVLLADSPDNRALGFNFAQLGAQIEVLAREPGGVILQLQPQRTTL